MTNIKNTTKTILFASLIAAMILPFSGMDFAFADVSPEIKEKAKQGADVWKSLKAEEKSFAKDDKKIEKLEREFAKYVKELNKHGIATADQWEENPDYWRSMSHPDIPSDEVTQVNTHSFGEITSDELIMSHTCGPCPDQKGYFISGFDWWIIPGIWKTSESADYWTLVPNTTQSYVSEVEADQYFEEIKPWSHYSLKYSGQIDWTSSHIVVRPVNVELQSSNAFDFSSTYVYPSYATLEFSWVDDVPKYSTHTTQASARLLH